MPKISIIMPSYNHREYIGEAIESVLMQDFTDFEFLIADDCSSDGSVDVIQSFKDERIRAFYLTENVGATKILEFLIEHSETEYIALINSDDRWCQGKLKKQYAFMENNPEYAACFTWADFIDENSQPKEDDGSWNANVFKQENRSRFEWLNWFYYNGGCLCHPSVLIRKSIYSEIGYYNGAYRQVPDYDFWIRLCLKYPIYIIQEVFVNHRRTEGENQNTSAVTNDNQKRNLSEVISVFSSMFSQMDDETLMQSFRNNFINKDASTREELICEKYFLLSNNATFGGPLKNLACQLFMSEYTDESVAKCFKEKYNYTHREFYKENTLPIDGFEFLFRSDSISLRSTMYYADERFVQDDSVVICPEIDGNTLRLQFVLEKDCKMIRIDPVEGYGIVIRDALLTVNQKVVKMQPVNAVCVNQMHYFLTIDPQYVIYGKFKAGSHIDVVFKFDTIFDYASYQPADGNLCKIERYKETVFSYVPQNAFSRIKRAVIKIACKLKRFLKL